MAQRHHARPLSPREAEAGWALQRAFLERVLDQGYDRLRVQIYECEHSADYDFSKNVRME